MRDLQNIAAASEKFGAAGGCELLIEDMGELQFC